MNVAAEVLKKSDKFALVMSRIILMLIGGKTPKSNGVSARVGRTPKSGGPARPGGVTARADPPIFGPARPKNKNRPGPDFRGPARAKKCACPDGPKNPGWAEMGRADGPAR